MMAPQETKKKRKAPTLTFSEPKPAQDLNEIDLEEMKNYRARQGQVGTGNRVPYPEGWDAMPVETHTDAVAAKLLDYPWTRLHVAQPPQNAEEWLAWPNTGGKSP